MLAASAGKMNESSHLILVGEISFPLNREKEVVHCHGVGEPIKTLKALES